MRSSPKIIIYNVALLESFYIAIKKSNKAEDLPRIFFFRRPCGCMGGTQLVSSHALVGIPILTMIII